VNTSSPNPATCPIEQRRLSRRDFLSRAWWMAGGILAMESAGALVASLWPKTKAGSFGSKLSAASLEEARAMPVGTVAYFNEGRFYLSRVESGLLALYRKCTHVGCVVPWSPTDPSEDSLATEGRFNCPCHAGIFDRYGVVHSGPPLRPLDLFAISIEDGEVLVDTSKPIERTVYDESQVARI